MPPLCVLPLCAVMAFAMPEQRKVTKEEIETAKRDDALLRGALASTTSLERELRTPEQLVVAMLSDVPGHQRTEDSRRILTSSERNRVIEKIRGNLAAAMKGMPNLSADWLDGIMVRNKDSIVRAVDDVIAAQFAARFGAARERAVATQRQRLATSVRPSTQEIERIAGALDEFASVPFERLTTVAADRGRTLLTQVVDRVTRGQDFFEENRRDIEQEGRTQIREELSELWRQTQTVQRHDGRGAVDVDTISQRIREDVQRASGGHPLFSALTPFVRARARAVEKERFLAHLSVALNPNTPDGCPVLPRTRILRDSSTGVVPASPDAHIQQLTRQWVPRARRLTLDAYVAQVPDEAKRQELSRRLVSTVGATPEAESGIAQGVRQCVTDALTEYRNGLARAEVARVWPRVVDLSQELRDGEVAALMESSVAEVKTIPPAERSGLGLDESRQFFATLRSQLLAEGKASIERQLVIVDEPAVRDQLGREIAADNDRSNARQKVWVDKYSGAVLARWRSDRSAILIRTGPSPLHPSKYDRVFQKTLGRIRDVVANEFKQKEEDPVPDPAQVTPPSPAATPTAPASGVDGGGFAAGGGGRGGGRGAGVGPGSDGGGPAGGGGGGGGGGGCEAAIQAVQKENEVKERALEDKIWSLQMALLLVVACVGLVAAVVGVMGWKLWQSSYRRGRVA